MDHNEVMRVLKDPLAGKLMKAGMPARMAFTGPDGYPRAIPIGYIFNGSHLVCCTAPQTLKVAALKANPHVALTIDTEEFPPKILLVRGVASIDIVQGIPEEYWEGSRKNVPPEIWDGFVENVKQTYSEMARIAIEPQWARIIDFETRLPEVQAKLMKAAGS
jgi:hypothetical protein